MSHPNDPMLPVRARADIIKRLLSDAKIKPDQLTAASLCWLAMKLLGVKGPDIEEFLMRGPFSALSTLWKKLEESAESPLAEVGASSTSFDPSDPNATITLTQAQLWSMIGKHGGPGSDSGNSH